MSDANLLPLRAVAEHLAALEWPDDANRDTALRYLYSIDAGPGCYTPMYAARLLTAQRFDALIRQVKKPQIEALTCTRKGRETASGVEWLVKPDQLLPLLAAAEPLEPEAARDFLATAASWKQTGEFEESLIAGSSSGVGMPSFLYSWFRFDTWLAKDAFRLLLGFDPKIDFFALTDADGEHIQLISARRLDGSLVCLNGWRNANVLKYIQEKNENIEIYDNELPATSLELIHMSTQLMDMKRVWDSGQHLERNAPSYYIDWAIQKGYEVPWLDWAREEGFLPGKAASPVSVSIAIASDARQSTNNRQSWQEQARAIADELFNHDTKQSTRNKLAGANGYSGLTAAELRKRGITGPNGPLSAGTVQREALQGDKWWKMKSKA